MSHNSIYVGSYILAKMPNKKRIIEERLCQDHPGYYNRVFEFCPICGVKLETTQREVEGSVDAWGFVQDNLGDGDKFTYTGDYVGDKVLMAFIPQQGQAGLWCEPDSSVFVPIPEENKIHDDFKKLTAAFDKENIEWRFDYGIVIVAH